MFSSIIMRPKSVYPNPYVVKPRIPKYFDTEIDGTAKRISIDRLKSGFTIKENDEQPIKKPQAHGLSRSILPVQTWGEYFVSDQSHTKYTQ